MSLARPVHCPASTFLPIIRNRQLWSTSLTQSGDASEGGWMFRRWPDAFEHGENTKKADAGRACHAVDMHLSELFALGTCLSGNRDLLSQGRGHTAGGSGFSISFDVEDLTAAISNPAGNAITPCQIACGHSEPELKKELFSTIHHAFSVEIARWSEADGSGTLTVDNSVEARSRKDEAIRKLHAFKSPAFFEAQESRRLIVGPSSRSNNPEFRETGGIISSFVRLPVPQSAFLQVTRGPTNRTPDHVLRSLLHQSGIDADIMSSGASYLSR